MGCSDHKHSEQDAVPVWMWPARGPKSVLDFASMGWPLPCWKEGMKKLSPQPGAEPGRMLSLSGTLRASPAAKGMALTDPHGHNVRELLDSRPTDCVRWNKPCLSLLSFGDIVSSNIQLGHLENMVKAITLWDGVLLCPQAGVSHHARPIHYFSVFFFTFILIHY